MIEPSDKIADIIVRYPQVKDELIERNKLFKNLDNPIVFKTVGRFARVEDMAKMSGENLDELLSFINEVIASSL